jgi:hypothetical protein
MKVMKLPRFVLYAEWERKNSSLLKKRSKEIF